MILEVILVVVSYLIGSISFSYFIGRLRGVDLRKKGDRNLGATNAYKVLGMISGVIVGVLDFFKGVLVVVLGFNFGLNVIIVFMMGIAAVLGHIFPFYLRFRGGMGLAVTLGVGASLLIYLGNLSLFILLLLLCLFYLVMRKVVRNIRK